MDPISNYKNTEGSNYAGENIMKERISKAYLKDFKRTIILRSLHRLCVMVIEQ